MLQKTESDAPTTVRYGVLAFACSLSLITYLDRICIARARTDIQGSLGFTDTAMGLVFSAFTLGYAIFEVPAGWMGDRWGARAVLTRIVIAWSLFTVLTGCVWPFSVSLGPFVFNALMAMVLVRFLFGSGEAGAYPNLTRVVSDWFPPHERGAALGDIWMYARIGGAIAPFVLGRLSALLGWRGAFWALGVVGIVWVLAFRAWFRDRPRDHPDCNEAEQRHISPGGDSHVHDGHSWPGWTALLGSVSVLALSFSSFWVCFGWYFYPTWQPKYLEDVFSFRADGWVLELITGLPFLCGAIGCRLGGRLSDGLVKGAGLRWGRAIVGMIGFVGAGLCVLATGWAFQPWQGVALLCLAFLINDLAVPVMWAASSEMGGRYAGSLAGLMNTVGAVGAMISPVMIPYVLALLPGAVKAATVAGPTAQVWDAQTGQSLYTAGGTDQPASSVALGVGGRRYAIGFENGSVRSLDAETETAREFTGPTSPIRTLGYQPYGPALVAGTADGPIVAWDADTGAALFTVPGHEGGTLALAFRLDGKRFVSGGADGVVRLWDGQTGEWLAEMTGHTGAVRGVAFAPHGRTIISAGDDGTLRGWTIEGQEVFQFTAHRTAVTGVAHSREGNLIASAAEDGTVKVWDAETTGLVRTIPSHAEGTTRVAFSPGSLELISGGADRSVKVYNSETGVLLREWSVAGPVGVVTASVDAERAAGRWRVVFAGLAGAWFLAALPWLIIDSRRKIGQQEEPNPPPPEGRTE